MRLASQSADRERAGFPRLPLLVRGPSSWMAWLQRHRARGSPDQRLPAGLQEQRRVSEGRPFSLQRLLASGATAGRSLTRDQPVLRPPEVRCQRPERTGLVEDSTRGEIHRAELLEGLRSTVAAEAGRMPVSKTAAALAAAKRQSAPRLLLSLGLLDGLRADRESSPPVRGPEARLHLKHRKATRGISSSR